MFRERFDRVFWIDASDAVTIHHSFENIAAQVLQPPGKGSNILPVINWLENSKEEWLIVVDSYDKGDISRYLPGYSKGNILFTCRSVDLEPRQSTGTMYHVFEMDKADSTLLLFRACRRNPSPELESQAHSILEELGSLPLAVSQAGANIRMRCCTFEQYLDELRKEKKNLLSKAPSTGGEESDQAVYSSFEVSWSCLKSFTRGSSEHAIPSQSAMQILNTFCFYHSEKIPMEMILRAQFVIYVRRRWGVVGLAERKTANEAYSTHITEGTDAAWMDPNVVLGIRYGVEEFDFDYIFSGIKMLVDYSLLTNPSDEAEYSIHPLVHSWLRDRMLPGTFDRSLQLARNILYHSFNERIDNWEAEQFYPSLLPHMKANNSHHLNGEDDLPFRERMSNRWVYQQILKMTHLWAEAITLLEEDIETLIYEWGPNDWRTLNVMIDLGKAYMACGRIIDAEDVLQQAADRVAYCSSVAGAKKCHVNVCSELSMAHLVGGNFGAALGAAEVAVKLGNRFGLNTTAATMRLCLVYQYIGRWDDALELAETVFEINLRDKRHGPLHHSTLKAETEVARIRARLGQVDPAEMVLADVAQKLGADLGSDHYDTLVARTNLAWIYFLQRSFGKAAAIQREVLKKGRSVLGSDHLYVLYMMLRLALTLGELGWDKEAFDLLEECVVGRSRVLWMEHPAVAGVKGWRYVYWCKVRGLEWDDDMTEEDFRLQEAGRRFAEHPYTPVQI